MTYRTTREYCSALGYHWCRSPAFLCVFYFSGCSQQAMPMLTYTEAVYCAARADSLPRPTLTAQEQERFLRIAIQAKGQALRLSETATKANGGTKGPVDVESDMMALRHRWTMEAFGRSAVGPDYASERNKEEKLEFVTLCGHLAV